MSLTADLIIVIMIVMTSAIMAQDVKGTFWAGASDGGGCQVPTGDYIVTDAIALGQSPALGDLVYRPGLCGQVVAVTCESGVAIPAVVVSTCNLGSDSCGVDMIGRTWNAATNNASPGEARCSVAMTADDPMEGGPRCYHRTGSSTDPYSRILGVLNTGGEIVASATLAGQPGRFSNGAWFEFNANGQPSFTDDAQVTFTFETEAIATFSLSECAPPGGVQIFS